MNDKAKPYTVEDLTEPEGEFWQHVSGHDVGQAECDRLLATAHALEAARANPQSNATHVVLTNEVYAEILATSAGFKESLATSEAARAQAEKERDEVRFVVDRDFVPLHEFKKVSEERESAMAERNFARGDQEAAEARALAAEAGAARLREALIAITSDFAPEHIDKMGSLNGGTLARAALADDAGRALLDELAGLRAKVAQLESNIDRSVCLDADGERIHFGARVVCGQCFGSQGQHLKNARAERDSLKAQLAQAEKERDELRDPDSEAHDALLLEAIKRGSVTSKSVLKAAEARALAAEAQVMVLREVLEKALFVDRSRVEAQGCASDLALAAEKVAEAFGGPTVRSFAGPEWAALTALAKEAKRTRSELGGFFGLPTRRNGAWVDADTHREFTAALSSPAPSVVRLADVQPLVEAIEAMENWDVPERQRLVAAVALWKQKQGGGQ